MREYTTDCADEIILLRQRIIASVNLNKNVICVQTSSIYIFKYECSKPYEQLDFFFQREYIEFSRKRFIHSLYLFKNFFLPRHSVTEILDPSSASAVIIEFTICYIDNVEFHVVPELIAVDSDTSLDSI